MNTSSVAFDASEDDPVKKELQAVAEDVATSVLQSSLTGSPILSTSPVLILSGEERHDGIPLDNMQTSFDSMPEVLLLHWFFMYFLSGSEITYCQTVF